MWFKSLAVLCSLSSETGYLTVVVFATKWKFLFCHSGCFLCYSEFVLSEAQGSNQDKASYYQL